MHRSGRSVKWHGSQLRCSIQCGSNAGSCSLLGQICVNKKNRATQKCQKENPLKKLSAGHLRPHGLHHTAHASLLLEAETAFLKCLSVQFFLNFKHRVICVYDPWNTFYFSNGIACVTNIISWLLLQNCKERHDLKLGPATNPACENMWNITRPMTKTTMIEGWDLYCPAFSTFLLLWAAGKCCVCAWPNLSTILVEMFARRNCKIPWTNKLNRHL